MELKDLNDFAVFTLANDFVSLDGETLKATIPLFQSIDEFKGKKVEYADAKLIDQKIEYDYLKSKAIFEPELIQIIYKKDIRWSNEIKIQNILFNQRIPMIILRVTKCSLISEDIFELFYNEQT